MIHYCVENGIAFKLYKTKPDGTRIAEVPFSKYQDKDGNLLDTKLVDDFPHPASDAADKTPVIAADFATLGARRRGDRLGLGAGSAHQPGECSPSGPARGRARKLPKANVLELIRQNTDWPNLGFLGDPASTC